MKSIGEITKLVAVYCPNKQNIHNGIYIRYLIIVGRHGNAVWIDDPSEEDCARLWARSSSTAHPLVVPSECPWCKALKTL